MALSLDPILQAAQDGLVRNPIVELVSSQFVADIPFDGQYLNDLSTAEGNSSLAIDVNGRVIGTLIRGGDLYFLYTGEDRLSFTEVLVDASAAAPADACVVGLSDGNAGIVYARSNDLYMMILSPTGEIVTGATRIHDFTVSWTGTPYAIRLSDGSYLMVAPYLDGGSYYLATWTSDDFTAWTFNGNLALTGLSPERRIDHPALAQATTGEIFLAFDHLDELRDDGSERTNIYSMVSTDGGATWSGPEARTGYSTFGTVGLHPDLTARPDGKMTLSFTEKKNVLTMDGSATGFELSTGYEWCSGGMSAAEVQFDPVNNKLYVLCIYTHVGSKALCSVVVIDVATWAIERCYTTDTIPAYSDKFADSQVWWGRWISTGDHTCFGITGDKTFAVVHHDTQEIVTYQVNTADAQYGIAANLDVDFGGYSGVLRAGWLDGASGRLYLYFDATYVYHHAFWIGYVDIHAPRDPVTGKYRYTSVVEKNRLMGEETLVGFNFMQVVPEMDYIVLGYNSAVSTWKGRCLVIQISSGGTVKDYNVNDCPGFHWNGVLYPIYTNGHIYAGVQYRVDYGQADRRGLMDINLETDEIAYVTPSFATADSYGLERKKSLGDGRILMSSNYGPCIYDTRTGVWTLYDQSAVPGLPQNYFMSFDFDPLTNTIFAGAPYNPPSSSFQGIASWNTDGAFLQGRYATGENGGSGWTFPASSPLIADHFDYDAAITVDPENSLWAFWTRRDKTETSIKWDKDGGSMDLSDFIVRGSSVSVEWHIGGLGKLSFVLSHGHLFDPMNTLSTLSKFLEKGRKVSLKFGERIDGADYWQDQGTFLVVSTNVRYGRGDYPTIVVECEDYRTIWEDNQIVATRHFDDQYPETVLQLLLTDHGGLIAGDLDIPTLSARHKLWCQFLDDTLGGIVEALLGHFEAFAVVGPTGEYSVREIDLAGAVSHVYPGLGHFVQVTPDDAYSDFVNRVVVKGEGRHFIEVLYEEESVGALAGMTGWWGKKTKERVWYSEDHERTCRDPRLEITQSIRDFSLFLMKGGGREYISAVDPNEKWVEITIESPNLVGVFIATLGAVAVTGTLAVSCTLNCGWYIAAMSVSICALFYVLGCVASYNYTIWARPLGHEKQTFQAEANDYALQRAMNGQVITQTIDDEFCYTVAECQRVADHELSIVQAQRRRLQALKISHLQDEVGDIIRFPHPYSGASLKIFLTDLVRTYTMPEDEFDEDGGMTDQVTGWRLISA